MTAHLMVRSCYSLLASTIRIEPLVKRAAELGYHSLALTDHNVMHGVPAFSHACSQHGIHPVYGLEADCLYHEETVPFLLLAKDNIGYQNLMRLSSEICSGTNTCSTEQLIHGCEHCYLIVYGEGGWFDHELVQSDSQGILEKLQIMKQELPVFDVALSYMDASMWKTRNAELKRIASGLKIRTVALNKIYYLNEQETDAYRVLTGIRRGLTIQDKSLTKSSGRSFRSMEGMAALYDADDLKRTDEIAESCMADLVLPKTSLPQFHTPEPLTSAQYLTQLCLAGLKKRLNGKTEAVYTNRLKYELDVILKMHFEDYFLIVYNFIRYARSVDIYIGPGRGSAAGSLVAYCLGITQVDPIHYHLLFERFLNPERITMPDIDTDIPDNRRQDVIDYVYRTYGKEHTASIVTFGTLGARQVIHDVGRVLNLNIRDVEMLSKMIPGNIPKITLAEAFRQNPRLKQVVNAEDRYRQLFEIAFQLEGLPRNESKHAGGVIISRLDLSDVIPTMDLDSETGMITSQYSMEYLEERGLIKMDFLGLRNLSIIDEIVKEIQKENPSFNIMKIPMDDHETYRIFQNADTIGVFQFESSGMMNLLRKMKPERFQDLVAALALFRPGPMENINVYLNNRRHPESIQYPAEALKPVLSETYGVMIYQEQIMMTARIAAGFSLGRADVLRRAISKKKAKDIAAMKTDFIKGCLANGYPAETAENLFALIEKFAGYGFNKSHAVAYGVVAYQLAYLKAVYPLYFYTALLDSVIGDDGKTSAYVDECRRRNIKVLYPDVNRSSGTYCIEQQAIRMPLCAVKGIGRESERAVIENRTDQGTYQDFFDCAARLSLVGMNRKSIVSLIDAGALDGFKENRATLKANLDDALSYGELIRVEKNGVTQINLGLVSKPVMIKMKEYAEERSENEKNALGFCLGTHPIIGLRSRLDIHRPTLTVLKNNVGQADGFAMIQNVHQHRTKRGDMMAFLKLTDETGEMDMAVMPRLYQRMNPELVKGTYILFHAKIQDDGSCLADTITVAGNHASNKME